MYVTSSGLRSAMYPKVWSKIWPFQGAASSSRLYSVARFVHSTLQHLERVGSRSWRDGIKNVSDGWHGLGSPKPAPTKTIPFTLTTFTPVAGAASSSITPGPSSSF
eukprot:1157183-Pelagomonas_calceolata.AAC.2